MLPLLLALVLVLVLERAKLLKDPLLRGEV
eukprot:SAG11_NODE_650_length_7931_cov_9.512385_5_plen_30_part_00